MFPDSGYLFLFIFIISLNYLLPETKRSYLLLVSGLFFLFCIHPLSLILAIALTLINYFVAQQISLSHKKIYLIAGLSINGIFILLFNFYVGHQFVLKQVGFEPSVYIIAAGLSFYSIQHMIYLADIAAKKTQWEKNFFSHLLAVTFFPKIISGPIITIQGFTSQIKNQGSKITSEHLIQGLHRFFLGLLKKMIFADRLAGSVHSVFDFQSDYPGITYLMASLLFTFQLYFDFSAYSDMAIGIARMLGYTLPENFNRPLRASSVSAFWRRWHMTLISIFTQYIYFPVVYRWRKLKSFSVYIGIIITFLISGLWHGLSLTFLSWALCHCLYLCFEHATKQFRVKMMEQWPVFIKQISGLFFTLVAVILSNIFFRSLNMSDAWKMIKQIGIKFFPHDWYSEVLAPLAIGGQQAEYLNFTLTIVLVFSYLLLEKGIEKHFYSAQWNFRYTFIAVLLLLLLGVFNSGERFIYMQF